MRIGIFGGTFDPVHLAHLILAEQCREACQLDRVLFVPAGQPPHKADRQITPGKTRLEMVELAIAGHPGFGMSAVELDRNGPSYSVETLSEIARQFPGDELFFLIGSDSLADLPFWYQPARIASLATIVVAMRPGAALADLGPLEKVIGPDATEKILRNRVEIPLIDISSTIIRSRAAAGLTIRYLVPRSVECYIQTHHLYAARSSTERASGSM